MLVGHKIENEEGVGGGTSVVLANPTQILPLLCLPADEGWAAVVWRQVYLLLLSDADEKRHWNEVVCAGCQLALHGVHNAFQGLEALLVLVALRLLLGLLGNSYRIFSLPCGPVCPPPQPGRRCHAHRAAKAAQESLHVYMYRKKLLMVYGERGVYALTNTFANTRRMCVH